MQKSNPDFPLGRHIEGNHRGKLPYIKFLILDRVHPNNRSGDWNRALLQRETHWIVYLDATSPPGLNDMVSYCPFLEGFSSVDGKNKLFLELMAIWFPFWDSNFCLFSYFLPLSFLHWLRISNTMVQYNIIYICYPDWPIYELLQNCYLYLCALLFWCFCPLSLSHVQSDIGGSCLYVSLLVSDVSPSA